MGRSRSRSPPRADGKTSTRDGQDKRISRDGEDKSKDKPGTARKREREQPTDDAEDERKKSALARFKRGRRRSSSISSSDSSPDRRETRRSNSNRNDARRDTRPARDADLRNEAKDFQRLMDLEKQRWLRQKELETKILEEHALKRTEAKIADRISEALITERVKFQQELKEKLDACKRDMKDQLREEVRQEFRWEMEQLQLREEIEKNKRAELEKTMNVKVKKVEESEQQLAEERLKFLNEKAKLEDERRAFKKEVDEWNKTEQRVILNRGGAVASRPRLSFALKPS